MTYAGPAGHALIGRALYLPADRAADEERRDLAAVNLLPDVVKVIALAQRRDNCH